MKATLGAIVREARELFRHHGYDGASMQDLATKVGLKKASLYTRFPTKEALVSEVLALTTDEVFDGLPDGAAAYATALERIARTLSDETRCVGLHLAYGVSADDTPDANAAVRTYFTTLRDRLATLLAPSVDGDHACELATDAIARLEGATVWTIVDGDGAPMQRAVRTSLAEVDAARR